MSFQKESFCFNLPVYQLSDVPQMSPAPNILVPPCYTRHPRCQYPLNT